MPKQPTPNTTIQEQSPREQILSRARKLNSQIQLRVTNATEHLEKGEGLGAIGSYVGVEDEIRTLTTLLSLLR
jgi:hypothetical protein